MGWTWGGLRHPVALSTGVLALFASVACAGGGGGTGGGGAAEEPPTTQKTEEITASLGQPVEVANLTATVAEVQRKQTVGSVSAMWCSAALQTSSTVAATASDPARLASS